MNDSTPNAKLVWLALKHSVMTNFGDVGWGAVSTSLNGLLIIAL